VEVVMNTQHKQRGMGVYFILALIVVWGISLAATAWYWRNEGIEHERGAQAIAAAKAKTLTDQQYAAKERELDASARDTKMRLDLAYAETEAARAHERIVYRTIKEEVPVYVTAKADAACALPVGFVVLHDAAAGGTVPPDPAPGAPAAQPGGLDRPSGVALSAATATIVDNYDTGHEWQRIAFGTRAYAVSLETYIDNLKEHAHVCP
jgi:hypothetical protein